MIGWVVFPHVVKCQKQVSLEQRTCAVEKLKPSIQHAWVSASPFPRFVISVNFLPHGFLFLGKGFIVYNGIGSSRDYRCCNLQLLKCASFIFMGKVVGICMTIQVVQIDVIIWRNLTNYHPSWMIVIKETWRLFFPLERP